MDPRQRQVEGLQHPPGEARPADADARGFHSRRRVRARLHGSRAHPQQWPRHRRGGGAPAAGIAAGLGTARRRSRRARVDGRKARRFARAGQAEQPFCLLHLLSRSASEPDRELALLDLDFVLTYAFENDDDTTLLGVFLPHPQHADFKADLEQNFVRLWESVAEAPPVGTAARAGEMRGMVNIPNRRRRAAGCGVAVVGDAALALDPIWGMGCGFAMQSAAWLVDETAATLADRHSSPRALDDALERYRRAHVRETRGHALHIEDFSRVRRNRLLETLLFSAATRDEALADTLLAISDARMGFSR